MSGAVIVTMRDVRGILGCSKGARDFCQRHGIDWQGFLDNGIPAERLEETGDAMALQLVAYARAREDAGRG